MTLSYEISESDLIKALKIHGRGSKATIIWLVVLGFAALVGGWLLEYKLLSWFLVLGGLIGYFFVYFVSIPRNARKQYEENRALRGKYSLEVNENGINVTSEAGVNNLLWSDLQKWKFANGIILLYPTSCAFHIIPQAALSDYGSFLRTLEQNLGERET